MTGGIRPDDVVEPPSTRRRLGETIGIALTTLGVMFLYVSVAWTVLLATGVDHGRWGVLAVVAGCAAAAAAAGAALLRWSTGNWDFAPMVLRFRWRR